MRDKNELCLVIPGGLTPIVEPLATKTLKATGGRAIVAPPIVGELDKVLPNFQTESRLQPRDHPGIAVDFP